MASFFVSTAMNWYEQRRRSTQGDIRRPSVSELEDKLNKPSTPLTAVGDAGPPVIVDFQEKYTATEGNSLNWSYFEENFFKSSHLILLTPKERTGSSPLLLRATLLQRGECTR